MLCRNNAACPAAALGVSPPQDGGVVEPEPISDCADAAAFGDDGVCRFHPLGMRYSHNKVNAKPALSMRSSSLCGKRIAVQISGMTPDELKQALEIHGRSQSALARRLGVDQSAVNRMTKKGGRKIKLEEMPIIEAYLRDTAKGLEPDLPPDIDARVDLNGVVMLNEYDARLSAGHGLIPEDAVVRTWPYPRFLIVDRLGMTPERSAVQEIMGDSMFPTLATGDFVVIDLGQTRVHDEGIFVVRHGDALLVKRIQHQLGSNPPTLKVKSDNPSYDEFVVAADELEVLGQIRWISKRA